MDRMLVFTVCTAGLLAAPAPAGAQEPADFSGVWVLDSIASDTLPAPPSTSEERRRRVAVRVGPPYGHFPEPYVRSIYDPERVREALDAIGARPVRLNVAATDTLVTISRDGAPPFTVRPDGEEVGRLLRAGLYANVEAEWDDGRLRIVRTLESGLEVTEQYELERSGRLIVSIEANGPIARAIEARWIYERPEIGSTPDSAASKSSM